MPDVPLLGSAEGDAVRLGRSVVGDPASVWSALTEPDRLGRRPRGWHRHLDFLAAHLAGRDQR